MPPKFTITPVFVSVGLTSLQSRDRPRQAHELILNSATGSHYRGLNVAAMVHFYNHVFDAGLEPFAAFGTTLYQGQLAGLRLVFCPNDFLGIQAEKKGSSLLLPYQTWERL